MRCIKPLIFLLIPFLSMAQNETEPNDSFTEASEIGVSTLTTAYIGSPGDDDFFKFNILKPGIIKLKVWEAPGNIDLRAKIFNPDQKEIYKFLNADEGFGFEIWVSSCDVGDFYVTLEDDGLGSGGGTQYNEDVPYKFQVDFIDFETADNCECGNESISTACEIVAGITYEALIAPRYEYLGSNNYVVDKDYYRFDVDQPSQVHLDVMAVPANIELEVLIYDSQQELIWSDYSVPEGQGYDIWFSTCTGGTHYIHLRDGSSSSSNGGADFNAEEPYIFQLEIEEFALIDSSECNNSFNDAEEIEICETISAAINPWQSYVNTTSTKDVDYYKIELEANKETDISLDYVPEETAICIAIYDDMQVYAGYFYTGSPGKPLNFSILPEEDGFYYIEIWDCENNFSVDDNYTLEVGCNLTSSTDNSAPEVNLNIFPNPSSGYLNIHSEMLNQDWMVRIFDLNGIQLYEAKYSKPTLNLTALEKGLYFLELRNGGKMIQKKIIVSK